MLINDEKLGNLKEFKKIEMEFMLKCTKIFYGERV